ncbi:MAG: hypothetical protein P1U42_11365 [Phycisphaerales bacterium]|nr:hypothetical protein [Phycisphaerales bacterium]
MNTNTNDKTTELRLAALERSANRWKFTAVSSVILFAGVLIGGMGANSMQPDTSDPKKVVGIAGTAERVIRIHQDGTLTYIRIPKGERSADGYFDWGDIVIDRSRKSQTMPQ